MPHFDSPPPRVLLFDLGGVLARFRGIEALAAWQGSGTRQRSLDELWRHWLDSETVRAFETGRLEPLDFAAALTAELEIDISPQDFVDDLREWVPGLLPGALELLAELQPHFRLAILSNTNPVHWPLFAECLTPYFERLFLSHQTGRLKPDEVTFAYCVEQLGVDAREVCFFDDSTYNVSGARAAGLLAFTVDSPAACRRVLVDGGWWPKS